MDEKEFINRYEKERSMYKAWGDFINDYILNKLKEKYINIDSIIKVPVSCRTKDIESLVAKAFYRNKNYEDPYNNITDKVGTRFVVMTEEQTNIICEIIEECDIWSYSKDVDFNLLRELHPDTFTYQSSHYIVRNKTELEKDGNIIAADTPCEIQIRTLQQHAYAEISHDLFYKKQKGKNNDALRLLARTAAFNEESDYLFGRVYEMVESKDKYYNDFMYTLKKRYHLSFDSDKINKILYDDVYPLIEKYKITIDLIISFLDENSFIVSIVEQRSNEIMFSQPIIYVLYYLAYFYNNELTEVWQLPDDMLDSIRTDLGISIN